MGGLTGVSLNRVLLAFAIWAFATVCAVADCASTCADRGMNDSSCTGTAPFCDGDCEDIWGGAGFWNNVDGKGVVDVGSCSSGSTCWSGSKRCCCREILADCSAACIALDPKTDWDCVPGDSGTVDAGFQFIGWCDADNMCFCYPWAINPSD